MSAMHNYLTQSLMGGYGLEGYGHPSPGEGLVPVEGDDGEFGTVEGDDDEVLGEAIELGRRGLHPRRALRQARANRRARRMARWQARCNCPMPMPVPVYAPSPYGLRVRGEEILGDVEGDDDDDLEGDDDEIEALGADDEEIEGDDDDGPEVLGANAAHVAKRISKLEAKLEMLKAKLAATPRWKVKRRNKIQRKIAKVQMLIAKKERKLAMKNAKLRAKFGVVPVANANPATLGQGYQRLANLAGGRYEVSRPRGVELSLPVLFSGANWLQANFDAAATAGSTAAISGVTSAINYADFAVTALQIGVQILWDKTPAGSSTAAWAGPGNDTAVVVDLSALTCAGNLNAFYADQILPGCGEVKYGAMSAQRETYLYRIDGLRTDALLEKNGTAVLTGLVAIPKSPEVAGSVIITASVIVQALRDNVLDRRG